MTGVIHICARLWRDERGHSSIEYALIASIISIAAIGALTSIGTSVNTMTNGVLTGLIP